MFSSKQWVDIVSNTYGLSYNKVVINNYQSFYVVNVENEVGKYDVAPPFGDFISLESHSDSVDKILEETFVEKFLPPVNQASTVTALAVVATAGAAATPLLIRVIKPVIKKIWATIQKKLGKKKKKEEQTPEQIAKKYKMDKLKITD